MFWDSYWGIAAVALVASMSVGLMVIGVYYGQLKRNEKKRSLTFSHVCHELRSTTNVLNMGVSMMKVKLGQTENPDQDQIHYCDILNYHAARLTDICTGVLDASSLQYGGGAQVQTVEVTSIVREYCQKTAPILQQEEIVLCLNAEEDEILCECSVTALNHILSNLISNAVKATAPGGRISVHMRGTTKRRRKMVEISVADTGCGVAEDLLPRVFELFVGRKTDKAQASSGLGLALVSWLVKAQHGTIQAESKVNEGSTFTVLLPIGQGERRTMSEMTAVNPLKA